jgi:hypothetical protein
MKPHWFQILLALADRDLHGSAIMEEVLDRTDGQMKLWPGTLYGSLHELTEAGYIRETEPPEPHTARGWTPSLLRAPPGGPPRAARRGRATRRPHPGGSRQPRR